MECSYCNKKIVPIRNKRKNGSSNGKDWDDRKLHVNCFTTIRQIIESLQNTYKHCPESSKQQIHDIIEEYKNYLI